MSSDDSLGTQVKDTFMKLAHGAAGEAPKSAEQGNPVTSITHPPTGGGAAGGDLRDHGAGKNGPNAAFRDVGKQYEDVRKSGDIKTMHAPAHGVDSHP